MTTDESLGWRTEALFLNAFPAPVQVLVGDMVARLGGGVSRRAASASPLRAHITDLPATVEACERLYFDHGRISRFRVPDLLDPTLDRLLAARGYTVDCDVRALLAPDLVSLPAPDPAVTVIARPDTAWLAAMDRLKGLSAEHAADYRASLAAIGLPSLFAALWEDGAITALCFGGLQHGLLAVEGVVTDPGLRNAGRGRRLVGALMARAGEQGATGAVLQVQAENAPAIALYARLGFSRDLHRYHFRHKTPGP